MSKIRKDLNQPRLPLRFPENDFASRVRAEITRSIHRSKLSAEQIAEGMSQRLGLAVAPSSLYSFCAPSHAGHRLPFEWAAAFCLETADLGLVRLLLDAVQIRFPEPGEADLIGYAKAKLEAERQQHQAALFKFRITGSRVL